MFAACWWGMMEEYLVVLKSYFLLFRFFLFFGVLFTTCFFMTVCVAAQFGLGCAPQMFVGLEVPPFDWSI